MCQTSGWSLLWKVSPLQDVMLLQFAVRSLWPRSLYGRPWTFQDHDPIVIKTETRPSHTSHFSPLGCDSSCLARLAASSWGPAAAGAQVRTSRASTLFTWTLDLHQGATLRAFTKQEVQDSGHATVPETAMVLLLETIQWEDGFPEIESEKQAESRLTCGTPTWKEWSRKDKPSNETERCRRKFKRLQEIGKKVKTIWPIYREYYALTRRNGQHW